MGNIFLQENIQQYLTDGYQNSAGIGEYVLRNDVWSMDIRPKPYYTANVGSNHVLDGFFQSNTRYIFDMWIDADDVYSSNANREAGIQIFYTDDSYTTCYVVGNQSSPLGYQHKVVLSTSGKSVSHIRIRYSTSMPTYYRADSYICPFDETYLYKTGVLETQNITESLTGIKNSEIKPGGLLPTEIIEL